MKRVEADELVRKLEAQIEVMTERGFPETTLASAIDVLELSKEMLSHDDADAEMIATIARTLSGYTESVTRILDATNRKRP